MNIEKFKKTPVMIWKYHEAPPELQISHNGGDEDFLALIPPSDDLTEYLFLKSNNFGCCSINEYRGDRVGTEYVGYTIVIGCHA